MLSPKPWFQPAARVFGTPYAPSMLTSYRDTKLFDCVDVSQLTLGARQGMELLMMSIRKPNVPVASSAGGARDA